MATYDPAKHVRSLKRRIKANLSAQKRGRAAKLYRNARTKYWRARAKASFSPRLKHVYLAKARRSAKLGGKIVSDQRTLIKRRRGLRKALKTAQRRARAVRVRASDRLWGGSRGVTNEIIDIVNGRVAITSRKRVETFGNPGSDHHISQLLADAVDFATANNYDLAREIARKLGGSWSGDYDSFVITRKGRRYRVQLIAGTHGTGPHLHAGVRRV